MPWRDLPGGAPRELNGRSTDMLLGQMVNELRHLAEVSHEVKDNTQEVARRLDNHEHRLGMLEMERSKSEEKDKKSPLETLLTVVPAGQMVVGVTLVLLSFLLGWLNPDQTKEALLAWAQQGGQH